MGKFSSASDFIAQAAKAVETAGYALSPSVYSSVIYGFFVKGDSVPFYIGSTRGRLEDRISCHKAQVKTGSHSNKHFLNKCRKAGDDNIDCIELVRVNELDQFFAERDLIRWALDCRVVLTNKIYNGINFEIDERYEDPQPVTPEKFWLGYRMTRQPPGDCIYPELQGAYEALHGLLKLSIDCALSKFPDEIREWYGANEYG